MLRKAEAHYLVGTPKSMLRQFERDMLDHDWEHVEPEVEVKLRPSPDGQDEGKSALHFFVFSFGCGYAALD